MFGMTRPCSNCPFRKVGGIRLHPERARDIAQLQVASQGGSFPCHKTVDYEQEESDGPRSMRADENYCAGALNFALNVGSLNQMMRIAERLGAWNADAMKDREACFSSVTEMVAASRAEWKRRR